jgi:hypothetical protein
VAGPVLGALKTGLDAAAMTPVGQQMIAGLQQGLSAAKSMGGWLQANVTGPIMGSIKGALGIASKSTVMMGVGLDMVAGLEAGLAKAEDIDLGLAIPSPLAGGGLAAGAAGMSGAAGPTINVYPRESQDEQQVAAMVSRELGWAMAGGVA